MILRELFVKLGLSVDEASFAKGELAAKLVEKGLERLVEWGTEAVRTVTENIKGTIEYGNRLEKTSQSIGIAVDALQELQYAGSQADLSAEEMSQSIGILSRNMNAAKEGSEEHAKAFHKLGVRVTDTSGKLRGTDEIMADLADKFAAMPNGAEKTAASMNLFGRAGKQMIPLLNQGAAGLEEMRQEARDLGLVMDELSIKAAVKLNDNFTRLRAVTAGLWRSGIAPLLPAINKLVERFLAWQKSNAGLIKQKIQQYIGYVIKGVEMLGNGLDFLIKNAESVKIILLSVFGAIAFASAEAALRTLAAWTLAAAPFVLIAGLLAGLLLILDDFRVYQKGGKSLFGLWKNTIDAWLKPNANDPWWLAAIKEFVARIREALDLIAEFDRATGRYNPQAVDKAAGKNAGQIRSAADAQTINTAKRRASMGFALTQEEKDAIARGGVSETSFQSTYGTPMQAYASQAPSLESPLANVPSRVINNTPINVYQQPGEDGAALAKRVAQEVVESHWNGKLEEANASVP